MKDAIARFAIRNTAPILFLVFAVCLGGAYAALHMPSSVFPQVNFPRVVILVNNGVMPADEMTASITRPIEESMKDIPGCRTIRSATGRGSAEIDVFFTWDVDMQRSELYVLSRLSQLQSTLPPTATTSVNRMTFAAFPIIGVSLTRPGADPTRIWETARYEMKPRLLRIPGVASVDVLGGETPEYHVTVDPQKLIALHLGLPQIVDALRRHNLVAPAGVHEQDNNLYLAVVDGRLRSIEDIENLTIPNAELSPIPVKSFASVTRDIEPQLRRVSADGQTAVLLNVYAQPDGSTVDISRAVNDELKSLRKTLPADAKLAFFYDQSLLVRNSVRGVWEAIGFGLILSIVILFLFLRSWTSTLIAVVVIPVAVLFTVLVMRLLGMGFNLMTLGGIAAAIGLVIDDAIVVVEAIYLKLSKGLSRADAVHAAITEIFAPLMGSTLTPVVVFIPLAFLDGLTGVFFRALAITMAVSLIASLVLALTLTPALAAWIIRGRGEPVETAAAAHHEAGGPILRGVIRIYEVVVVLALRHRWFTAGLCIVALFAAWVQYGNLDSNFLPAMDEGGFVIDYTAPPGTSLTEIDRQMRQAEKILSGIQDIESFSRRSGAALCFALVEPNTGDFLVKLKDHRKRDTKAIIADVRARFNIAFPLTKWDFPGILSDLIGDLTLADQPIEVKIFSTNDAFLREASKNVVGNLSQIPGVVDIQTGIIDTGPTVRIRVRSADAQHFGLTTDDVSQAVNIAMLGREASTVLEADRLIAIRVKLDPKAIARLETLNDLPLRAADGSMIRLRQVADVAQTAGEMELHRDDLRQNISVVAELEGRDLGSTMRDIKAALENDPTLPPVSIEYGGSYQEQQESFRNLQVVLGLAIVLVFMVALLEFRSFYAPIAIVFGALLSTFGIVVALHLTGTSLSVVAFLGAIIGMGIVHKNGILMLDHVHLLHEEGMTLEEALVYAGRRRLRPVLMTSMAAAMGMLPLAWGVGSGTDILRPLAITVIGAVCVSVLLSLIATPVAYYLLLEIRDRLTHRRAAQSPLGFAEEERQQQ